MNHATTKLRMLWTLISALLSWILATLTSRLAFSSCAPAVTTAASLRQLPSQQTFIRKLTRLLALLVLNGAAQINNPLLTDPHQRLRVPVTAGLVGYLKSTLPHNPRTLTKAVVSLSVARHLRSSDSLRLNRTRKVVHRTRSRVEADHHVAPRHLVLLIRIIKDLLASSPLARPRLLTVVSPTPDTTAKRPQVLASRLMVPMEHLPTVRRLSVLPTKAPALMVAMAVRPTTTACRRLSLLTLNTHHLVELVIPLILRARSVKEPKRTAHHLRPCPRARLLAQRTVRPLLDPSACVNGRRSLLPRSKLTMRTVLVLMTRGIVARPHPHAQSRSDETPRKRGDLTNSAVPRRRRRWRTLALRRLTATIRQRLPTIRRTTLHHHHHHQANCRLCKAPPARSPQFRRRRRNGLQQPQLSHQPHLLALQLLRPSLSVQRGRWTSTRTTMTVPRRIRSQSSPMAQDLRRLPAIPKHLARRAPLRAPMAPLLPRRRLSRILTCAGTGDD